MSSKTNTNTKRVNRITKPWKPVLLQEERLLKLLYHRNKNQHAVATWWRQFSKLKRLVSRCVKCIRTRQYNALYRLIVKFQRSQLKQMYYEFNGVIGLGQFVTLGVVLVGHLARVNNLFKQILESYGNIYRRYLKGKGSKNKVKPKGSSEPTTVLLDPNGEDIGEALEVSIPHTDLIIPNENLDPAQGSKSEKVELGSGKPRKEEQEKKKKKKSKSKSAIDDIFGL